MTDAVRLLYRDEYLVAVDKPSGVAVHRGWAPERDVMLTRVRDAVGSYVYPVHRLDRGASGVLLFALDAETARALGEAFASGEVEKRYLALVRGVPEERLTIDHPVLRGERGGERVPAVTEVERLEVFGRYSLVAALPKTGRLHQIRRHLKHVSCPLIGDVRYGKGEHNRLFRERYRLHRLFLHASELALTHPKTGAPLRVSAPLGDDLAGPLEMLAAACSGDPRDVMMGTREVRPAVSSPNGVARRAPMTLTLRTATLDDLELLRRWDEAPHVVESDPNDDWGWEIELARAPDWREQLVAEVDGRPIGFVQIIDPAREDSHYWGDCPPNLRAIDIWIGEADELGKGHGTRMMTLAIERCFADEAVEAILIDPLERNARARRFYERLGFRFVERRRFGEDDCAVYRLDRTTFEATGRAR